MDNADSKVARGGGNEEASGEVGRSVLRPYKKIAKLGFDLVGGGVPGDGGVAEVGFVGHVAG